MFSEFSTRTSIHGLRYVGERRRMLDIIFWSIALTIACIYCVILIMDLWTSWKKQPISITLDGNMINVRDLPFPAITICPFNKMKKRDSNLLIQKLYESNITRNCTLTDKE